MLQTIKHQQTGDLVKVAQYLTGYAEMNTATGVYDADFVAYMVSWQTNHGLTADGVIGPKTWEKIAAKAKTCSTSKNKKSAYTCAVQILVGGIEVDGIYGKNTKNAVASFQAASKLSADGICGSKTWAALIGVAKASTGSSTSGGTSAGQTVTGDKVINNCMHYLQWDSRWKKIKYSTHTSEQTIGNSGCGPTAMAMILATFIDPKITPVEICALSVANGFRTYNSGTSWDLFPYIFKKYEGFSKYAYTNSIETLKAGLKSGALAVCSMNSNDGGFWTKSGHFITAIGYDDTYIYANDPNSKTVPRKQAQSKFKSCMKRAFLFWPAVKEEAPVEEPAKEPEKATTGSAIIDISKWQGNINFEALKSEVAFVIARAGVGSDADPKFDEYAAEMIRNKIPFGVYCYSYAATVEKAQDEAQKLVQRASKYNPLFYVMDAEEEKVTNEAIRAFASGLKASGAERIGCYVAHNRYKAYGYDSLRSLWHFTWIPRYGSNDGTISGATMPSYVCDLWQYTSTGKIAGISGNVDMNVITGTGKSLEWFLGKEEGAQESAGEKGKPAQDATKTVVIHGGNVNVRTEPNTSGKILGVAYKGTVLEYGGETASNGWLSVIFNGEKAWLSNKYGKLV